MYVRTEEAFNTQPSFAAATSNASQGRPCIVYRNATAGGIIVRAHCSPPCSSIVSGRLSDTLYLFGPCGGPCIAPPEQATLGLNGNLVQESEQLMNGNDARVHQQRHPFTPTDDPSLPR